MTSTLLLRHFAANATGRDFVVGDIHGCFDAVRNALRDVNFAATRDRLFSVGDLVDRGPSSEEAVEWIAQPWFHAVRGNHEQMALGVAIGRHDPAKYASNGGQWMLDLPPKRRKAVAAVFGTLPVAIEIDHPAGKIGIVHADVPGGDWAAFTATLQQPMSNNAWHRIAEGSLWNRERFEQRDASGVGNVALVCVGHSPIREPLMLGNVAYVDTGCVFGGKLTLLSFNDLWTGDSP
ncbi:MAG TPA: metallophosphoesterase [Nevskiaceae bacterium]|nr:metallophosphoesterase [Nevskiaceae bacterium]